METKIHIHGNKTTKVVLQNGAIDISHARTVAINDDGQVYIDGTSLDDYIKSR